MFTHCNARRGNAAKRRRNSFSCAADCAFAVTALGQHAAAHEKELRRLLAALPLRALQWVNVFHQQMDLVTLTK